MELPRGVLGDAAWDLARVTHVDEEPPIEAIVRVSSEHWSDLREAIGASLRRAEESGTTELDSLIALTEDDDPSNPLALALAEQAGRALAGILERASARMATLPGTTDAGLILGAAGAIAADCLDLSSADFEDEIETYLRAGETPAALRDLARDSGDAELRAWAHEALDELDRRDLVEGISRLRAIVSGAGVPADAADDLLWVGVVTSLAEEAIDIALAAEVSRAATEGPEGSA